MPYYLYIAVVMLLETIFLISIASAIEILHEELKIEDVPKLLKHFNEDRRKLFEHILTDRVIFEKIQTYYDNIPISDIDWDHTSIGELILTLLIDEKIEYNDRRLISTLIVHIEESAPGDEYAVDKDSYLMEIENIVHKLCDYELIIFTKKFTCRLLEMFARYYGVHNYQTSYTKVLHHLFNLNPSTEPQQFHFLTFVYDEAIPSIMNHTTNIAVSTGMQIEYEDSYYDSMSSEYNKIRHKHAYEWLRFDVTKHVEALDVFSKKDFQEVLDDEYSKVILKTIEFMKNPNALL